jgi:gamma-glutamyl-gamma-aminobutyrate hydrolase PuuD
MKLALTPRLFLDEKTKEVRAALDIKWIEFLESAGFETLCLPFGTKHIEKSLKDIDGLILTGGGDLYSVQNDPINKMRDDFEDRAMEAALSKEIPVLGICRGMQFIAHKYGAQIYPIDGHVRINHEIQSCTNEFNEDVFTTNSFHNYGVTLPNGFELLAHSMKENAVEAFANREKGIFGIMWHPERHTPFRNVDVNFLKTIFKVIQ